MRTLILTLLVAIIVVASATETASAYCRKRGPFIVEPSTEIAKATGGVMKHCTPVSQPGKTNTALVKNAGTVTYMDSVRRIEIY